MLCEMKIHSCRQQTNDIFSAKRRTAVSRPMRLHASSQQTTLKTEKSEEAWRRWILPLRSLTLAGLLSSEGSDAGRCEFACPCF